jgi:HK97 family phage portal protein
MGIARSYPADPHTGWGPYIFGKSDQSALGTGQAPTTAGKRRKRRHASPPWMYSSSAAPIHFTSAWTDNRAEQVLHFKEAIFKALDFLGSMIARQQPNVSATSDGPSPLAVSEPAKRKALVPIQAHEELIPVDPNHRLCRLLFDVNEEDSSWDLWYETVMFLMLTGTAYWWAPADGLGLPAELWVIPSHWVWPVAGRDRLVDHYEIRSVPGGGRAWKLPYDEVIYFRRPSPISKLDGWSPQTAASLSIDLYESIRRSQFWGMKNGVNAGLAVEFDPDYGDPSEDDLYRIEQKFMQRYSGENRSQKPMLVPPGAKVKPITHSPKELDFAGTTIPSEDAVLETFRIPPVVLGRSKDMTYGSVAGAMAGACAFAINPLLTFLSVQVTQKLAWRFDERLRVWFSDATPDDPAQREKELETDLKYGIRTPNEGRRARGLPPYPHGGDDPYDANHAVVLPWGTGGEPQFVAAPPQPKDPGPADKEDD